MPSHEPDATHDMTHHDAITTGVFPAMITPFHSDGRIDHETLAREASRLEEAGVDGIVPVGSTGESATLSHAEHVEVVETVVEAVDDVPVVAGAGSNNTSEAIELSEGAESAGADGLLLISPYYNKPEPAGMQEHFEAIADAIDLPQIVYNVPGRTGRSIEPETTEALAAHDNIVGYKAASGDLNVINEVIERTEDAAFNVLAGDDVLTVPICSVGGTGVISVAANIDPVRVGELTGAALSGDFDRARQYQRRLGPLFRAIFIETNPIPVKEGVAMQGRCEPHLRSPLSRMSEENRAHLREIMADLDLLEGVLPA